MIAYRFQNLADHPRHGVLIHDDTPTPAVFFTPMQAKRAAVVASERLTIAKIQAVVSEYYNLAPEHMRSRSRDRSHVYSRQMAMLLVRQLLPKHGLTDIGRRFGGRDHTTIMYGLDKVRDRITGNPATESEYETLEARLRR